MFRIQFGFLVFILLLHHGSINAQQVLGTSTGTIGITPSFIQNWSGEEKFRQLFMVCGEPGKDSSNFSSGIFGFQLSAEAQLNHPTNQGMNYAEKEDGYQFLSKVNSIQRFFKQHTSHAIPVIIFDEALHGLVQKGATCFPQSIAMAASFNDSLVGKIAQAIALETKARGIRMVLSPVVNVATDVRWGRVEETYGEDPLLVSRMGLAYVQNIERNGILSTPKHFVVNHGDGGRDSYPIHFTRRYLEEFYFRPFKTVIQQGNASAIMTAYNSYDGKPCSANSYLLQQVLRHDWGFKGIVISDAGATGGANVLHFTALDYEQAGKKSIEQGLDVIFQSSFNSFPLFSKPFIKGTVHEAAVDSSVYRVLQKKKALGLLDHPYTSDSLLKELDINEHKKLAYQLATESAVLLKNNNQLLPLKDKYPRILVVGSDAIEHRMGGYSGTGNQPISILKGLKHCFDGKSSISFSNGCARVDTPFVSVPAKAFCYQENGSFKPGLQAKYYNSMDLEQHPVIKRTDAKLDFQWTLFGPSPEINYDHFAAVWEGYITCDSTGIFNLGIEGNDGWILYLNDTVFLSREEEQGFHCTTKNFYFKSDTKYPIKIVYKEKSGNARFRLIWNKGRIDESEKNIQQALDQLNQNDVCIVVAGIEEGEFRDRSTLKLPGKQEEEIKRLAATGKPVVVLLVGGSAITMSSWMDEVDAILDVWYPGEEGGRAIADLLYGKKNPSGKLPITFPVSEGQLPLVYNHLPTGRGDDYLHETGQPLFPFGYGLSYTHFEYDDLTVNKIRFNKEDTLDISCSITNTGNYAGDEVVQLYSHDELASVARPIKELKNFQRVSLQPSETKRVHFYMKATDFCFPNEDLQEITEEGYFRIMIGSSSKDIRLRTLIEYKHD